MMVVDIRNSYETQIGRFEGSIGLPTSAFKEFPSWVEKNLFMQRYNGVIGEQKTPIQEIYMEEKEQEYINCRRGQIPNHVAMYCKGRFKWEKATSFLVKKALKRFII